MAKTQFPGMDCLITQFIVCKFQGPWEGGCHRALQGHQSWLPSLFIIQRSSLAKEKPISGNQC